MSVFSRLSSMLFRGDSEAKTMTPRDLFLDLLDGMKSSSGKSVTVKNAIQVSTVFAICKVIGEDVGQVPWKLMKESSDGRKRVAAKDHPLYDVLYEKPNEWQDSIQFREQLIWHCLLTGNHFSFINRGLDGRPIELLPLDPSRVKVDQKSDFSLVYTVEGKNGDTREVPADLIWHVRGPSWNGFQGLDVVKLAREAIGLSIVTEESIGKLHKNGIRSSGVYAVEGKLNPTQYKELLQFIKENNTGSNEGGPMILDRNAKWTPTQMKAVDAQALETRKFQIEEICRYGRLMPIMIGYSDKASTYASAEQMFLAHVVHTLAPWFARLEKAADTQLLSKKERADGYYTKFTEAGLLRGSAKDTKDVLLGYVNGGLMTPNEGRAKLDLDDDTDPESDKLRIPANITGAQEPSPAPQQ